MSIHTLWGKIIAFLSHHAKNFPCICGTKDSNDNPQLKLLHPLQGRFKTCNVLETFRNCYFGHSHSLPVCISHVCLQELITHLVNKIGIHRERQYVTVVPYMVLKLTRYWPVSYGWPSKGHISFSDCFRGLHCCSPSSSTSSHHKYEITVRNIWSIYTTYPTSICATKNAVSLL